MTLLSHWRRHPIQAVTLVVGLALATALWSGVQALNQEARRSYADATGLLAGPQTPTLMRPDGQPFSQDLYVALRRAGWQVSPILDGPLDIRGRRVRLIGVDPVTLAGMSSGPAAGAESAYARPFLTPPWRTLAAPETLEELGLEIGGTPALDNGRTLPPVATLADLPPGTLMVDIGVAQRLLGAEGLVSRLLVGPRAPLGRPSLQEVVGDRLKMTQPEPETDVARLTDSFHLNLTAFGLLSFAVGLFIVHSAIGLAFEQRRPAMRTMRAAGVSLRTLTAALLLELLSLALAAGLIGMVLGYAVAAALLPDVAATLRGLYGATVSGELTLSGRWWLSGMAMTLAGAGIAAAGSLMKLRRLPVLDPARPQAWLAAWTRHQPRRLVLALALFAAAALLLIFGRGLLSGFAVIGGVLLGGALALPVILSHVLEAGERMATSPLAKWMWADSRQQLSGLSLALMALLLALAANIGVGSMVGGFRLTFTDWLDERLAADVYVRADTPGQAMAIEAFLARRPEVTAVLPGQSAQSRLAGLPVGVEGFTADPMYRTTWHLFSGGAEAWDEVRTGHAALVNEQLANRLHLRPGDTILLPTPAGDWRLTVAGTYADYGNPLGELRVDLGAFRARWPGVARTDYALRLPPEDTPALITALRREFGLAEGQVMDQSSIKTLSRRIFERTFTVTAALNTLTLGVAGVALLMSLLTLATLRLPQVAPLWAMGVMRRRLALMDLAKTLALAALTAVLAIPLGVMIAWCLVAVVNVQAFGWRLPLHLFPLQWLQLFVLAIITALLASILPATALWRRPPAELVKVFSDER